MFTTVEPILFIIFGPTFEDGPPPTLYLTKTVVSGLIISPKAVVLIKSPIFIPDDDMFCNCCWSLLTPLPKVNLQKLLSVNSLTNFLVVVMYLPGFTAGLSLSLVESSTKTLSSANESNSYHLKLGSMYWSRVGRVV